MRWSAISTSRACSRTRRTVRRSTNRALTRKPTGTRYSMVSRKRRFQRSNIVGFQVIAVVCEQRGRSGGWVERRRLCERQRSGAGFREPIPRSASGTTSMRWLRREVKLHYRKRWTLEAVRCVVYWRTTEITWSAAGVTRCNPNCKSRVQARAKQSQSTTV